MTTEDTSREVGSSASLGLDPELAVLPVTRVMLTGSYKGAPAFGAMLPLDTKLRTGDPLYDQAAIDMQNDKIERLRGALHRITHFTSATPSLSESGCGRLLAQIEHEALKALGPNQEINGAEGVRLIGR